MNATKGAIRKKAYAELEYPSFFFLDSHDQQASMSRCTRRAALQHKENKHMCRLQGPII